MAAYLLNNTIGATNQSGFPSVDDTTYGPLQLEVDLSAVPAVTVITAGGQKIGNIPITLATLTAADTVDISNLPANAGIMGAYINTLVAQVGGTTPTVSLTTVTGGKALVTAASLAAVGVAGNTGADLLSTAALKVPIIFTVEDKLRLSFGGTLGTGGKIRVTVELIRL